jgi:hypothetical protein
MSIYSFNISNSKDVNKNEIKASEHHDYISRNGKYSPEEVLEKEISTKNAEEHLKYIERKEAFSRKVEYEDLVYSEDRNMPKWAKENSNIFWKSSEIYERANGRTYSEFLIALPYELNNEENKELVDKFCMDTFGESFVYSYGIHSKPSSEENIQNIHVHIMFCERKLDGIERSPEQFFKRYNPKYPERGGAAKDRYWNDYRMFKVVRKSWEKLLNEKLEEKGLEKVSCESLEFQRLEAKAAGDIYKEEFLDRPPVNCDGKILIKLKKYGMESLTKKEKEEYELFELAKEIKKNAEEIYKMRLSQNKEITHEDYIKQVLYDRAKYSYDKANKFNLEETYFNLYEAMNRVHKNEFFGIGSIIDSEENPTLKTMMNNNFYNAIDNLKEEGVYKENYNNIPQKIKYDESLKHNDFFFEKADIKYFDKISEDTRSEINTLKKEKKELIKNYKKELDKIDKIHFKEFIEKAIKNYIVDEDVKNLNQKYKEIAKLEEEINGTNKNLLGKVAGKFLSVKKVEQKKTLEKEIDSKREEILYKKGVFDERLKFYNNFEKEAPEAHKEYKKIFDNFRIKLDSLQEEIIVRELLLETRKEEENKILKLEYEKVSKKENFIEKNENSKKQKTKSEEENKDEIINELKFNIGGYCQTRVDLTLKKEQISNYEKLLKDKERIEKIALTKNTSYKNIYSKYSELKDNLEKEFNKEMLELKEYKYNFKKVLGEDKYKISESLYENIFSAFKKERKRLFSKLDEEKKANQDSSSTFKEIKKLRIAINALDILYNKENSEDNKGKEKNDIPGEIKTEKKIKVAIPNLIENNDIKIERVNKSKINTSKNKNTTQKETGNVYIDIPKKKKRKKRGLFDDEYDDYERD